MVKKRVLGQYFTKSNYWLLSQVKRIIINSKAKIAYDPFAGNGDLLNVAKKIGLKTTGLDIDPAMGYKINDSLLNIPKIKNSIIITNPPYLTKYSAKRKKILKTVIKYFEGNNIIDLYQLAIIRCLASSNFVVMIIPETFVNNILFKERISSITILEKNPFSDTENPVCVVCFDNKQKTEKEIKIYKDKIYIGRFSDIRKHRMNPHKKYKIRFNERDGKIALRAVDLPSPHKPIQFLHKNDLKYNLDNIKHSSRLITIIDIKEPEIDETKLIFDSNTILNDFRKRTSDILLSPFKGNNKIDVRRRRLDYKTARAILELAINKQRGNHEEFRLF